MIPEQAPCVAVIVAGGKGLRMQNALPKQFLPLQDKPILYHTIAAFIEAIPAVRIVLVLPTEQISYANMVLQQFSGGVEITIVHGGPSRFHSVKNGLLEAKEEDIIFVHDGVRPLVSPELIQRCYAAAQAHGSAIPAITVSDSIRQVNNTGSIAIDRNALRAIQTPQTFKGSLLLPAFAQEYREDFTDEASVVECFGQPVHLVEGEKSNLKITTPEDLLFAAALLNQLHENN
ncbi:2-C-methyl-D-erythritol 4-phosphate cytidylyltransferase [Taibaiella sp. KBW10]|uniref:2-C-methyl-D-erythritol 4-phosphate cytidylyltransferase n=1 Tax=Taibaiella sp. KBW10 TaxID=2153357 RepID=UPI000F598FEE|nr:2-C-methyl-D-erythritol 4-phosphate cytidylyltransferase [Taibaiella sp. KBW10]RQO30886.1 2-C-methyl-D-erythritol 4-phosphate cytidylyltransferase [Taibaiella sp. KBW10]